MSHAEITKISLDDPQSKSALEIERRLFEYYDLQVQCHNIELKQTPIRVRVLEVGSGQPIVIVPGGDGAGYGYAKLITQLKDRRLIVINRPGGGLSDVVDHRQVDLRELAVDMLSSVMDAFGLESVPIICNSMGGLWSNWFALAQPQRVSCLIHLGCPALILNTSAPLMMRLMSVPGLNRQLVNFLVPRDLDSALMGLKMMGSSDEVVKAQPRLANEASYAFAHLPAYRHSWRSLLEAVLTLGGAKARYRFGEESLARLQMPVLLIWGDQDPFGS